MNSSAWLAKLAWVQSHSPYTLKAIERFPHTPEISLSVRFHIDLKMVPVIEALSKKVTLQVFPCHQDTTDEDGWNYLAKHTTAELVSLWSPSDCHTFLQGQKSFLCDLGGEMIEWALGSDQPIQAALEGTTSGIRVLERALKKTDPRFPIVDWNNARLKREIHNEKMVGFSIWQTFSEITRLSLHGKRVTVLGFGPVGRGIARMARALGAQVIVYDTDKQSTLTASFEGFSCPDREAALALADILVTATGSKNVLTLSDLETLPSGCFLVNAGHSEDEIASEIRNHPHRTPVLNHIEALKLKNSRQIYLLARGRLLNLAAGFGDTINAFDITSAQLLDALSFTLECPGKLANGIHQIQDAFFQLDS